LHHLLPRLIRDAFPAPPPEDAPAPSAYAASPDEQVCFDALIDPSLQTNFAPEQWATPPFLPEHGVFLASADEVADSRAKTARAKGIASLMATSMHPEVETIKANKHRIPDVSGYPVDFQKWLA
jgi:hypothetical protein